MYLIQWLYYFGLNKCCCNMIMLVFSRSYRSTMVQNLKKHQVILIGQILVSLHLCRIWRGIVQVRMLLLRFWKQNLKLFILIVFTLLCAKLYQFLLNGSSYSVLFPRSLQSHVNNPVILYGTQSTCAINYCASNFA